eukprot:7693760-Ditylum_brightwellii.AAC.1
MMSIWTNLKNQSSRHNQQVFPFKELLQPPLLSAEAWARARINVHCIQWSRSIQHKKLQNTGNQSDQVN